MRRMVYPGNTGVAPRTGMVLAPQWGQNTAVAGTSVRQRGQLVVGSWTSPATFASYPPPADVERRRLPRLLVRGCPRGHQHASSSRSRWRVHVVGMGRGLADCSYGSSPGED